MRDYLIVVFANGFFLEMFWCLQRCNLVAVNSLTLRYV